MKCYEAVAAAETFVSTDCHSFDSVPPLCESTRACARVRVCAFARVFARHRSSPRTQPFSPPWCHPGATHMSSGPCLPTHGDTRAYKSRPYRAL
jgi:hypothetical protein